MNVHYFAFSNIELQFYFPVTQGCRAFCKSQQPGFVFTILNNSITSLSFVISLSTLLCGLFMNTLNSMDPTTDTYGITLVICETCSYALCPRVFPHVVIILLRVLPFQLLYKLSGWDIIEKLPIHYQITFFHTLNKFFKVL